MTPAELYAMEKAKHGVSLPRAEGCPRREVRSGPAEVSSPSPPATTSKGVSVFLRDARKAKREEYRNQIERRNGELARWYTDDGLSLQEVVAKSAAHHGTQAIYTIGGLSRILRANGVEMRQQGAHTRLQRLRAQYDRARTRNEQLRAEVLRLRKLLNREAA